MLDENFYSKKDVYTEKIEPLILELKNICNSERMPMFVSVATDNQPEGTTYASEVVLASTGTALTDNRIASILLSLNGFEIDYPDYIKKNIREIEEFVERTKSALPTAPIFETELTDDKIVGFQQVVMGGCKTSIPDFMKRKPSGDDVWED